MMVNGPILPINMRSASISFAGIPKEAVVPLMDNPVVVRADTDSKISAVISVSGESH